MPFVYSSNSEYLEDTGNLKCHSEHVGSLMEGEKDFKKRTKITSYG